MLRPQHVSELLRERLRRAAVMARRMSTDGPVLGVAEVLDQYGLADVELNVDACEVIAERPYTTEVPDRFVPDRTVSAQRKDYTVAVPFHGDPQVIRALLSGCVHSPRWEVVDSKLRATFTTDPRTPPEQLRAKIDAGVSDAAHHIKHGQADLAKYRDDLTRVVTSVVAQVNAAYEAGERQRDGLGLPVRTTPPPDQGSPVSAPAPHVSTDESRDGGLDTLFERVVAEVRRIGHELESFTGLTNNLREEEHIRDVVIVFLRLAVPECEFTAETLHGQGKNDIHVRYGGRVVCVIEFKQWSTERSFKDSIDQLLSYLTYRDTRAAIVLLIRRQDVGAIIDKTKQWLLGHGNCDDQDIPAGRWRSDFLYHATGDPAQPVRLVYLPFAFTTSATGASTTRGLPGGVAA